MPPRRATQRHPDAVSIAGRAAEILGARSRPIIPSPDWVGVRRDWLWAHAPSAWSAGHADGVDAPSASAPEEGGNDIDGAPRIADAIVSRKKAKRSIDAYSTRLIVLDRCDKVRAAGKPRVQGWHRIGNTCLRAP